MVRERCVKEGEEVKVRGGRFFKRSQARFTLLNKVGRSLAGARPPSRYPSLKEQKKIIPPSSDNCFRSHIIGLKASPDRIALFADLQRTFNNN